MNIEIEDCKLIDNYFQRGEYSWSAVKLIEAAKECPEFDMPLAGFCLDRDAWKIDTLDDFIYHMKRCHTTDENYPIIFDDRGNVADGLHRICKAIAAGKETIRAKRLTKMPTYDAYTPKTE